MLITIKEIYQNFQELSKLEKIAVGGWVKTFRQNKFVELNDGSCLQNLQVICTPNLLKEPEEINRGSSLIVSGKLILTPERKQTCELRVGKIEYIGVNSLSYLESPVFPWINSGVLTNLYFLTEHTSPSKLISDKAKIECQLPSAQPQTVLISDIDLNPTKIVWISPRTVGGKHVWQLLGTDVWQLLGTDVDKIEKNASLFFSLRQIDFSRYASGSIINHLRGSELMNLEISWIVNKSAQTRLLLLLNSPLAKIKDLHSQIKDLLLLKYF